MVTSCRVCFGLLGLVVNVPALLIVSRLTRQAEKTEGEAFLVCAQTPGA